MRAIEEMREGLAQRKRCEKQSMGSQVIIALQSSFCQLVGLRGRQVFMGTYTKETQTKEIVHVINVHIIHHDVYVHIIVSTR